jgi:hypothetical protein
LCLPEPWLSLVSLANKNVPFEKAATAMNAQQVDSLFPIFFVCWAVFGIGSWIFIVTRPTAESKRIWHRRTCILAGIIFGLFTALIMTAWRQPLPLLFVLPFIALIMWLNIKMTHFCDSCGKMTVYQNFLNPFKYCPKCGTEFGKHEKNEG